MIIIEAPFPVEHGLITYLANALVFVSSLGGNMAMQSQITYLYVLSGRTTCTVVTNLII